MTFTPPPVEFTDERSRRVALHEFGDGPVDDEDEALVSMYGEFTAADRAHGLPPVVEGRVRSWLDHVLEGIHVLAWHDPGDGPRPVGDAMLVPDDEDHELAIFVHPDYQQARIGTHLIRALLGAGRRAGVAGVWLLADSDNEVAVALYERVGFDVAERDGSELTMRRSLDA